MVFPIDLVKRNDKVPGMDVPTEVIDSIKGAGKGKAAEEGIKFAIEQIEEFKEMEGMAGVHLMTIEWEHRVAEIAERAKCSPVLLPATAKGPKVALYVTKPACF